MPDVPRETFTRELFAATFEVPRETLARLDIYAEMLSDWQPRMNLVGPMTLATMWDRHFADSAQLAPLISGPCVDLGAGAGFPGLVLAIMTGRPFTLIEATAKKVSFLRAVVAATEANIAVVHGRIETIKASQFSSIVARACAPLVQLFDWGLRYAGPATQWILPKGASVEEEITTARKSFDFEVQLVASITNADARIVVASKVGRR